MTWIRAYGSGAIRSSAAARGRSGEALFDALRQAVAARRPPPIAAWLSGPIIAGTDRIGDPLTLGVVESASALGDTLSVLRPRVAELERRFDITIHLRGLTPADLAGLPREQQKALGNALPPLGIAPLAWMSAPEKRSRPKSLRSHATLDARARSRAREVADRIARDPSLVERARAYIARRMPRASAGERAELEEWDQILRSMSIARLRRFLVDPGERASRLRQTNPFLATLDPDERSSKHKRKRR